MKMLYLQIQLHLKNLLRTKEIRGKLLQISTDYVFNGNQNEPYKTFQD